MFLRSVVEQVSQHSAGGTKGFIAAAAGAVPVIGPALERLITILDAKSLLFFAIGSCLVLMWAWFGRLPASRPSESVLPWLLRALEFRSVPASRPFRHVQETTGWRSPYIRTLEQEGDAEKSASVIRDYLVYAMEQDLPVKAKAFDLVLMPAPGFRLSGFAFRETANRTGILLQPLRSEKLTNSALKVKLPNCERGDRIHLLLRAGWTASINPSDASATFQPRIEPQRE